MAFFEELSRKFSDTVDVVSKKGNEVIEIQKLRNQVRVLERSIDEAYIALGKKVFDMYQDGVELNDEDKELCEEIAGSAVLINEYEHEIAQIKGEKICEECGASIAADALFCPKCGAKSEEEKAEEPEEKTCECEAPAEEACACETEAPAEEPCACEAAEEEACECEAAAEEPCACEEKAECGCTQESAE